jgi:hypothetical protein
MSRNLVDSLNFDNKLDLGQSNLMIPFLKMQYKSGGQGAGGGSAIASGSRGGGSATGGRGNRRNNRGNSRGNKGGYY